MMILQEYITLRPAQLQAAINAFPAAYVPLGSLEWHGPHLPLGLDGLKAEALLRKVAERLDGGILFPTMYWHAFGTMNFPFTFHFKKYSAKRIMKQLYDMGFRIILMVTGHYPGSQVRNVVSAAKWLMRKHRDAYAIGIPEQYLLLDTGYIGDHAAAGETSLCLALEPDLADPSEIPPDLDYMERCQAHGIMGKDPAKHASVALGKKLVSLFTDRMSDIITRAWKEKTQVPIWNMYHDAKNQMATVTDPRTLAKTAELLGMDSPKDLLRHAKWTIFKGGKPRDAPESISSSS